MKIKLFGFSISIKKDANEDTSYKEMVYSVSCMMNLKDVDGYHYCKIYAIKAYREWFHQHNKPIPDLRESKEFVESLIK